MFYWDRGGKWTGKTEELVVLVELCQAAFLSWFTDVRETHSINLTYITKGGKKEKCRTQHKSSRWCG